MRFSFSSGPSLHGVGLFFALLSCMSAQAPAPPFGVTVTQGGDYPLVVASISGTLISFQCDALVLLPQLSCPPPIQLPGNADTTLLWLSPGGRVGMTCDGFWYPTLDSPCFYQPPLCPSCYFAPVVPYGSYVVASCNVGGSGVLPSCLPLWTAAPTLPTVVLQGIVCPNSGPTIITSPTMILVSCQ